MSSASRFFRRLFGRMQASPAPVEPAATPSIAEVPAEKSPNFLARSRTAKYKIGQVVKHRVFPFRGVIFDVDPEFANTEEWYEQIPEEVRPHKDQPYYHLFAENERTHYIAYVSEQNLLPDDSDTPVGHPDIADMFEVSPGGYILKGSISN